MLSASNCWHRGSMSTPKIFASGTEVVAPHLQGAALVDPELQHHDGPTAEPLEVAVVDLEVVHPLVDQARVVVPEVLLERVHPRHGATDAVAGRPSDPGLGDQRHAGPVGEVDVGGRVEHDEVGPLARAAATPTSSRSRAAAPAGGGGVDRLGRRHPHLPDGERDAQRHRGGVARAGVAVGGEGDRDAGVEQRAGVGVGLAGRELDAGQQRGDGAAVARARATSASVEVGAVVDRGEPELGGEPHARAGAELVGVQPRRAGPAAAPAARTARAWSASKAPVSQNASIQRACGAAASSIGPVTRSTYAVGVARTRGTTWAPRNVVSSVNCRATARLRASSCDGEAVAALDLDGGGALAAHLLDQPGDVGGELLVGGRAGGGDRGADAAGGVRLARPSGPRTPRPGRRRRPGGEWESTKPGQHRAAAGVDLLVGGGRVGGGADPGDRGRPRRRARRAR